MVRRRKKIDRERLQKDRADDMSKTCVQNWRVCRAAAECGALQAELEKLCEHSVPGGAEKQGLDPGTKRNHWRVFNPTGTAFISFKDRLGFIAKMNWDGINFGGRERS